jgi:hypothetical protein
MNEIKIKVKFKKGLCYSQGIKLVQNDYNSTKLVFEFDDEEGTKIFELRDSDDNVILADEIVNNELILARFDEHDNAYPIFTKEGEYVYEVSLYKDNSKLTSASDKFKVNAEQVIIDGEIVETYTPMFDNLLSDLSSALQETDNIDIDVEKVGNKSTVSITNKEGINKTVQIFDGTDGIDGVDGISPIANVTQTSSGATISITDKNGTTTANVEDGTDGVSLQFMWQGTYLGVKTDDMEDYEFVNLKGQTGATGPQGNPFQIKKTYANVQLMINDYDNMEINDYVMISGNIEQEDNAKMFTKTETEDPIYKWQYLADFSGASGVIGPAGASVTSANINNNGELVLTVE